MRPKDEPVKTPTVVSSDRKGPAQASMPEPRPQALLVENTRPVPVAVSEPMPEFSPMVPLPPDIDPSQVAIVRHDVKKTDGERFKYVDKTLRPLNGSDRRPEVIKYSDKHSVDVIKYQATSAVPKPKSENASKPAGDVLKYKPVRVEIN